MIGTPYEDPIEVDDSHPLDISISILPTFCSRLSIFNFDHIGLVKWFILSLFYQYLSSILTYLYGTDRHESPPSHQMCFKKNQFSPRRVVVVFSVGYVRIARQVK